MSKDGEVLPVEVPNGTPVLPEEVCLKLIDEIEQRKRDAKTIEVEEPEEDIELQSIWPQLSTVVKWMIESNNEEALKLLHLIIQQRAEEYQRKNPDKDVTSAIRSTIMSLIEREETILEDLMKPQLRRGQSVRHSEEEDPTESWTPNYVDALQSITTEEGEEDKIERYMRIVRLEVGRSLTDEEKKVIVKAVRATKETRKGDDRAPPWRKDKERPEKATSPFDEEEKERADERFKTLKNTLTDRIKRTEDSESSSSGEYTYDDDSEGDFQPAKDGTPITTTNQPKKEQMTTNTPRLQEKSHTEERRKIPIIQTIKKEKSPPKRKKR